MRYLKIFDSTLRDGEQAPGFSMSVSEKIRMAASLEKLGVDVIEAGFPAASPGDFESVKAIAAAPRNAVVAALARLNRKDIDLAAKAIEGAAKGRIHVFIATSDIHLDYKLHMTRTELLAAVREYVAYAASKCADVEFSAEDATRSDLDFLIEVFKAARQAGAGILNIPDITVVCIFRRIVKTLKPIGLSRLAES